MDLSLTRHEKPCLNVGLAICTQLPEQMMLFRDTIPFTITPNLLVTRRCQQVGLYNCATKGGRLN